MDFKKYLESYAGLKDENKWGRITIGGLIALCIFLSMMAFQKDTIVTMQPVTMIEEGWVSNKDASASYKKSWGHYLSMLLGNVTPDNVSFIKESLGPILSPRVYNEVMEVLESQSLQIITDRVTLRFEPRDIQYEESSDKVFVYGRSFIGAVNTKEKGTERTYEFRIKISNYMPTLEFLDLYDQQPKTQNVLDTMASNEAKQRERKAKMDKR